MASKMFNIDKNKTLLFNPKHSFHIKKSMVFRRKQTLSTQKLSKEPEPEVFVQLVVFTEIAPITYLGVTFFV